jgi:hypothetical protein
VFGIRSGYRQWVSSTQCLWHEESGIY